RCDSGIIGLWNGRVADNSRGTVYHHFPSNEIKPSASTSPIYWVMVSLEFLIMHFIPLGSKHVAETTVCKKDVGTPPSRVNFVGPRIKVEAKRQLLGLNELTR